MRNILRVFFAVIVGIVIFNSTVYAAEFGGVGGRPAYPDPDDKRTRQWFIYTLNSGETKKDEVLIQNNGDDTVTVMLYPADSTPSTDGGFALEQMVEPRDFVGAWTTLEKTEVTVGPHESIAVPFSITVPNDPSLGVGEYSGGILIQKIAKEPAAEGGLQLLTRVGVRIYVTIPGDIVKKLSLENLSIDLDKEKKLYSTATTIKNEGNVSQDITINMAVENVTPLIGRFFKTFPIKNERNFQVLRGTSFTSNFEFPKPLIGKLSVKTEALYENKLQRLETAPLIFWVPPDRNVVILFVLIIVFAISLTAFITTIRKHGKSKKKRG
ncbi:MAG: DUF916 domain-containing protein [Patescibacteria group bacterium]